METTNNRTNVRKRLFDSLEQVPERDIREISDFVEFILNRRRNRKLRRANLPPQEDPILKIMGSANVKSFSKDIDHELYE